MEDESPDNEFHEEVILIGTKEDGAIACRITPKEGMNTADALASALGVALAQLAITVKQEQPTEDFQTIILTLVARSAESARYASDCWLAGDLNGPKGADE